MLAILVAGGLAVAALLLPKETLNQIVANLPLPPKTVQQSPLAAPVISATAASMPVVPVTVTVAPGQPVIHHDLTWFSIPTPTPSPIAGTATVQSTSANLRAGPGTEYPVIGTAAQEDTLPITGRNLQGSWLKVQVAGTKEAWIFARLVATDVQADTVPIAAVPATPAAE